MKRRLAAVFVRGQRAASLNVAACLLLLVALTVGCGQNSVPTPTTPTPTTPPPSSVDGTYRGTIRKTGDTCTPPATFTVAGVTAVVSGGGTSVVLRPGNVGATDRSYTGSVSNGVGTYSGSGTFEGQSATFTLQLRFNSQPLPDFTETITLAACQVVMTGVNLERQ